MTDSQMIGAAILCVPFLILFAFMVWDGGWAAAIGVFTVLGCILAAVAVGAALLTGEIG